MSQMIMMRKRRRKNRRMMKLKEIASAVLELQWMPSLSTMLRCRTCTVSRRSSLGNLDRQRSTLKLNTTRSSTERRANTCLGKICSGVIWPLILPE